MPQNDFLKTLVQRAAPKLCGKPNACEGCITMTEGQLEAVIDYLRENDLKIMRRPRGHIAHIPCKPVEWWDLQNWYPGCKPR